MSPDAEFQPFLRSYGQDFGQFHIVEQKLEQLFAETVGLSYLLLYFRSVNFFLIFQCFY